MRGITASFITNVDGALTSDVARLTVIVPPRITPTVSLQNWALDLGTASSFVVAASGTPPLSFQWRLDGRDLAGKTQNTLALTNLQPADGGDYTVVVTNAAGAVTSEPARLWIVPPAAGFIKSNFTNQFGVRLPYFYLLPTNYTAARRYPLVLNFHGSPGDETMITTPTGYANYPRLKVFASYHQQEADPTILLWPARRAGDAGSDWSPQYLQLTSGLLGSVPDGVQHRHQPGVLHGFSEGAHAAWDLIAMRPGLFAGAGLAAGWAGSTPPAAIKDVPFWVWCARDDGLAGSTDFARQCAPSGWRKPHLHRIRIRQPRPAPLWHWHGGQQSGLRGLAARATARRGLNQRTAPFHHGSDTAGRSRNECDQSQSLGVRRGLGSRGDPSHLDELRQQCDGSRFGHERLERDEHPAGRRQDQCRRRGRHDDQLGAGFWRQHDVQRRADRNPGADPSDADIAGDQRALELDWRRTALPRAADNRFDRRRLDRFSARCHAAGEFALGRHGGLLPHYRAMTTVTDDGANKSVTLPATNSSQFFRLRRP